MFTQRRTYYSPQAFHVKEPSPTQAGTQRLRPSLPDLPAGFEAVANAVSGTVVARPDHPEKRPLQGPPM